MQTAGPLLFPAALEVRATKGTLVQTVAVGAFFRIVREYVKAPICERKINQAAFPTNCYTGPYRNEPVAKGGKHDGNY